MNPTDYYELQLTVIQLANANFEIWLGASFGVIVAFHFAGDTIRIGILRISMFLYVSTSLLFVFRFCNATLVFVNFNKALVVAGHATFPATPGAVPLVVGGSVGLMLIGTVATVLYAANCYKRGKESTT